MEQHTDSHSEHRSVDNDAVPAVEAEMSECNCANEYQEGEDVTHLVRLSLR